MRSVIDSGIAERSQSKAGLIMREHEPVNLEFPFDQLNDLLIPNDLFYVRNHFRAPKLDSKNYALQIVGAVQHPFSIGYKELQNMTSVTRVATLECAGNGRVFLTPQVEGAQWQLGAMGTANWTGVPLTALLERAGLAPDACEVVFEGADKGMPKEKPLPPGDIHYARSIDLAKADDVLIAYRMNGEEIPQDHGFPVRAIVPGYYGMASVKWLSYIRVIRERFTGYWQTSDYAYWDDADGNPVRKPLRQMALKSSIARPRTRELLAGGLTYRVFGAAWTGGADLDRIEVSTDSGRTWEEATFIDPQQPFVWRRWEFAWHVPQASGEYTLKSRARDVTGRIQPDKHDKRFGSYAVHHTVGVDVVVR